VAKPADSVMLAIPTCTCCETATAPSIAPSPPYRNVTATAPGPIAENPNPGTDPPISY